ncbi:MAG: TonB-dependent receptor [Pseudomonadota bacterium]
MKNRELNEALLRSTAIASLSIVLPVAVLASDKLYLDIPPQQLGSAIEALSSESGRSIAVNKAILGSQLSRPVRGRMTTKEALQELIGTTSLRVSELPDGGFTVRRAGPTLIRAQAAPGRVDGGEIDLDTIVVEGELLDRNIQDTQTSVEVVTGEQLEQRSDPDLFTVIERTPGVTNVFGRGGVSIRGVNQTGYNVGRGNSLLVSTTVDGAVISDFADAVPNGPYSTWDLGQIEILRGPQSTQTGRNALAGAINIRSRDPGYEREIKLRGELAKFDTLGGAFAVNVPVMDETLAFRFSGDIRGSDGFISNPITGDKDAGRSKSQVYRAALRWDPTVSLSAILKYTHAKDETGTENVDIATIRSGFRRTTDIAERTKLESDSVNLRMRYNLTDQLTLDSETTYYVADRFSATDADGTGTPTGSLNRYRDFESVQQQLKLLFQNDRVNAVAGVYYNDYLLERTTTSPGPGGISSLSENETDVENGAVFGEVEFRATDDILLVAGFRYDEEKFKKPSSDVFLSPMGIPLAAPTVNFASGSYSAFLPKLGIVYDFTEDASLGFTWQKGYRGGGVTTTFTFPPLGLTAQNVPFDPEFTDNFELAFRSQWLDRRLTVNANAFYTKWKDQQIFVFGPNGFFDATVQNAGESEFYGGELKVTAQPTPEWDVFGSAAFVQTEFLDFVTLGQDLAGNEFADAPTWTAAFGGMYTNESGWWIGADASYTASSYGDAQNTTDFKNDARFLVNVRAGYKTEAWELFAFVRNLFDERYLLRRSPGTGGPVGTPGEPLTAGVVLNVRLQ